MSDAAKNYSENLIDETSGNPLYKVLTQDQKLFSAPRVSEILSKVDHARVQELGYKLATYISTKVPQAINKRKGLADYRINPYVVMTSASFMRLTNSVDFGRFLVHSKLYAGLETSFGKSIESVVVGEYPFLSQVRWIDPPEKVAEQNSLSGLSRQEKARRRRISVWREIDKSYVSGNRRFLLTIKSGPNCINDTQVSEMMSAIGSHHLIWMTSSQVTYPDLEELDIVIGLTYGTDRTTNNKENQILVKLMDYGFVEEDRRNKPGVLIDVATRRIRVYRRVGQDFWAMIGDPSNPSSADFLFAEILLALAKGLSISAQSSNVVERLNANIAQLGDAILHMAFPSDGLPNWMVSDFSDAERLWFATAISAFYDRGI
jgi:hypothetical protein